jgi:hypothetical protein
MLSCAVFAGGAWQGERVGGAGELFPIEIFTCHLAFLATILSRPRAGQDSAVARAVNTCSYCSFRGPPTCFMPGNSNCCRSSAPSPTVLMASICASDSPAARRYRRSALLSFRSVKAGLGSWSLGDCLHAESCLRAR